jgi:alpha-L-arabinofuranosidase
VECDRLKAKNYVREEILKMANFVKKSKKGGKNFLSPMYPSWKELERQVPLCTEPTFVDGWVNWVVQNKKKAKDASKGDKKKDLGTQEDFKRRVTELVTDNLATQVRTASA